MRLSSWNIYSSKLLNLSDLSSLDLPGGGNHPIIIWIAPLEISSSFTRFKNDNLLLYLIHPSLVAIPVNRIWCHIDEASCSSDGMLRWTVVEPRMLGSWMSVDMWHKHKTYRDGGGISKGWGSEVSINSWMDGFRHIKDTIIDFNLLHFVKFSKHLLTVHWPSVLCVH